MKTERDPLYSYATYNYLYTASVCLADFTVFLMNVLINSLYILWSPARPQREGYLPNDSPSELIQGLMEAHQKLSDYC
jgi:hypothetical protein